MFGFSYYYNTKKQQEDFINKIANNSIVFTSFHLHEIKNPTLQTYEEFLKPLKKKKCQILVDISPKTLKQLNLTIKDIKELKKIGITILRIDFGFSPKEILEIMKTIKISLNASTITKEELEFYVKSNINLNQILFSHNFYPKLETGLSKEFFIKQNFLIKTYAPKAKLQAFVVGDKKRPTLKKGLPTLEQHRNLNPFVATLELLCKYKIDLVLCGDLTMKKEDVLNINDFITNKVVNLKMSKLDNAYQGIYQIRYDTSENLVRLLNTRKPQPIKPNNTIERKKGVITVDNEKSFIYNGEMSIILNDLKKDKGVNVVGMVDLDYLRLLPLLDATMSIKIK